VVRDATDGGRWVGRRRVLDPTTLCRKRCAPKNWTTGVGAVTNHHLLNTLSIFTQLHINLKFAYPDFIQCSAPVRALRLHVFDSK
jgi:hypothetical protein